MDIKESENLKSAIQKFNAPVEYKVREPINTKNLLEDIVESYEKNHKFLGGVRLIA